VRHPCRNSSAALARRQFEEEHINGLDEAPAFVVDFVLHESALDAIGEPPRVKAILQRSRALVKHRSHPGVLLRV